MHSALSVHSVHNPTCSMTMSASQASRCFSNWGPRQLQPRQRGSKYHLAPPEGGAKEWGRVQNHLHVHACHMLIHDCKRNEASETKHAHLRSQ